MFWPIPFLSPVLHHITLNIKIYINIKKKKKKKKKYTFFYIFFYKKLKKI